MRRLVPTLFVLATTVMACATTPSSPPAPGLAGQPRLNPICATDTVAARSFDRDYFSGADTSVLPPVFVFEGKGPTYPSSLKRSGIEGGVRIRFIVDTTGTVLPRSVEVITSNHVDFLAAVCEFLPQTRFTRIPRTDRLLRSRVTQAFEFKLRTTVIRVPPIPPAAD